MEETGKGPWQRNVVIINENYECFLREEKLKTKEDKRMVKLNFSFSFSFQNYILWIISLTKKINKFIFLVHGHSS
jgi:hypothetical protein